MSAACTAYVRLDGTKKGVVLWSCPLSSMKNNQDTIGSCQMAKCFGELLSADNRNYDLPFPCLQSLNSR